MRFDRRRSANRALLVSPPPRGAGCPKPVSGPMLERGAARAPGFPTSCTRASQLDAVATGRAREKCRGGVRARAP